MKFFAPLLALAAVAVATEGSGPSTTTPMCCKDVKNSSQVDAFTVGLIKTLLGVDVSGLNVPIGTGCTPIAVLGGVSCNQNAVQCGAIAQGSLIGINCVPIIANV